MKKRIIGLGAVVAAVLIAPNFIGSVIESKYKENLLKVANNPFVNIVESDFKRSWFSAVATMKLTPVQETELSSSLTIDVVDTLTFGPIVFNESGISFNLAASVVDIKFPKNTGDVEAQEIYEVLDIIEKNLSVTTALSYGLSYSTHFEFNELDKSDEEISLFFGDINGNVTIAKDQSVSSDFSWTGFKLMGPEEKIDFDGLTMQSQQTLVSGDIYAGNALFAGTVAAQLPKLSVKTIDDAEILSFDVLELEATSSVNNNLMDIHSKYHLDALHAQGEKAENINLDFTIKNLGAESIKKMNDYLIELSKTANAPANQQQIAEIMTMFDELLDNNPEINIDDFSLSVPEGLIKANFYSSLASDSFSVFNPASALEALTAKTEMHAPSELFNRLGLTPIIDIYVGQGLIVKSSTELKATASFGSGQLEVNGNVLPLF